jgi:hypothetical protein
MKSEKEIWQALIDGETIVGNASGRMAMLGENGSLTGNLVGNYNFGIYPERYSIYKKPKEIIKMYLWVCIDGFTIARLYSECGEYSFVDGKVIRSTRNDLEYRTNTFIEVEK